MTKPKTVISTGLHRLLERAGVAEAWGLFVHDDVHYSGRRRGLSGYREMLERDFDEIPDLHFNIDLLISDPPYIASRLGFDCTPKGKVLGLPVNGRKVSFTENVFYQFRNERSIRCGLSSTRRPSKLSLVRKYSYRDSRRDCLPQAVTGVDANQEVICLSGKSMSWPSSPFLQNFSFPYHPNHLFILRHPAPS